MHILHYTLGLPPYRSGGLTKYATDLLVAQSKVNNLNISLLYPSQNLTTKVIKLDFETRWNNINIYKIKSTLPIPLLHGIKNPKSFLTAPNMFSEESIDALLMKEKIDIFHIHTLMGLPLEFLEFLKNKGTKIIYTSHDYFGLCLKANFIDNKGDVCTSPSGQNCYRCNFNSMSRHLLYIRNLKLLYKIKSIIPALAISKINRHKYSGRYILPNNQKKIIEYEELLKYYQKIFKLIDVFHFNSNNTKNIYDKYIDIGKYSVIHISNESIADNRKVKDVISEPIRLTFIGNLTEYKGFPLLKSCLTKIMRTNTNWIMNVWGSYTGIDNEFKNIIYRGKYGIEAVEKIFVETDLLIVPSKCNETFSLITLEALSFGVPVLVSSTVGAKDIVSEYCPLFIFEDENDLLGKLKSILNNKELLIRYNERILELAWDHSFSQHINEISTLYKKTNENSIY